MKCKHKYVIVTPNNIEIKGDGVIVKDLDTNADMRCQKCSEDLPLEDLIMYDEDHIAVGIPKDLIDKLEKEE